MSKAMSAALVCDNFPFLCGTTSQFCIFKLWDFPILKNEKPIVTAQNLHSIKPFDSRTKLVERVVAHFPKESMLLPADCNRIGNPVYLCLPILPT